MSDNRYKDKPLLRFVEFYVLSSIGELSEETTAALAKTSPHLAKTYGRTGDWFQIIQAELDIPPDLPPKLAAMWQHNRKKILDRGEMPDAEDFARWVTDEHLLK